jgi:GntR family transcriptional regulator
VVGLGPEVVQGAKAHHRPGRRRDLRQLSDRLLAEASRLVSPGGTPAHAQIEHWLSELIAGRRLVPGDKLPNEKEMAAALRVSRMTLRQALSSLENRGVVQRTPGRHGGTFIVEPRIDLDITGLPGFTQALWRGQVRASARLISATTVAASEAVAQALQVERGTPVHEVVRVRTARRQPLALERSYLPAASFPGLLDRPLRGSLYAVLRRCYDRAPHTASELFEPHLADAAEAGLLGVGEGAALMLVERTAYSVAGEPVEFARDLFRPDRVRIRVRTAAASVSAVRTLVPGGP